MNAFIVKLKARSHADLVATETAPQLQHQCKVQSHRAAQSNWGTPQFDPRKMLWGMRRGNCVARQTVASIGADANRPMGPRLLAVQTNPDWPLPPPICHLARMFEQAGIPSAKDRAREVWILSEGAMVLALIHGDRGYIRTAAARRLLTGGDNRRA